MTLRHSSTSSVTGMPVSLLSARIHALKHIPSRSPSSPQNASLALVDELKPALRALSPGLAHDIVYAVAPAMRAVREAYSAVEARVDERFGAGLLAFNEACQVVELSSIRDEEKLRQKQLEHKVD
jgi:hypothetical protein